MATTTNFGWATPDDTDLVKDGAAAIRTLGSSIDTSFVDLKGGTTNQVLAKNSDTDLDFKWVADASGIAATIFDAKGDLIAASAADTAARLAVGANGTVLTADSGESTGLKWAPASAIKSFSLLNSGGTSLSGATTVTVSGLSGYDQFFIQIRSASAGASDFISVRFNGNTGTDYSNWGGMSIAQPTYGACDLVNQISAATGTEIPIGRLSTNAASGVVGTVFLSGANTSGVKPYIVTGAGGCAGQSEHRSYYYGGIYTDSNVISSISIVSSGSNLDAGTVYIYGAA